MVLIDKRKTTTTTSNQQKTTSNLNPLSKETTNMLRVRVIIINGVNCKYNQVYYFITKLSNNLSSAGGIKECVRGGKRGGKKGGGKEGEKERRERKREREREKEGRCCS